MGLSWHVPHWNQSGLDKHEFSLCGAAREWMVIVHREVERRV